MKLLRHFKCRSISEILRARDGVSAVEFALIAPLMLLLYFGCIELSFMMMVDRKVTTSTATLGDLTARAATVTDDDLADIFQATRMIFQPYDVYKARLRISSLYDDKGTVKVGWSDAYNISAYTEGQSVTVPDNLVPEDRSIIYAEIESDYESTLGYFITTKQTLKDKFYLRPRRVNFIKRERG